MIRDIGGDDVLEKFSTMIETTEDINFEAAFKKLGCELKWQESQTPWLGADFEYIGDRVFVKHVIQDSPAYKAGLNSNDEILFLNGLRFEKSDADKIGSFLILDRAYELLVSRLNKLQRLEVTTVRQPRQLKEILVVDRPLAEAAFRFSPGPVRSQPS
jgi:predicted metalloprotease with PDZ domain